MQVYESADVAISATKKKLYELGQVVNSDRWQSTEISQGMWELFGHSFSFKMPQTISQMQIDINPNLPWADDHFEERVGRLPLNPPPSNAWWPFAQKNNNKFKSDEQFSHTYPERIWPHKLRGMRYKYGNFDDVIKLLYKEPLTRQAFLPIWFPEDTGVVHKERVPCTLGYQFIVRNDFLHIIYYIRSCDFLRHFKDDIYMACRKANYVLQELNRLEVEDINLKKQQGFGNSIPTEKWKGIKLGYFQMHITSLHVFENEKGILKQNR
tara:strand:- start:174 stop:974 length:801 start_codon:yes stop_codon:yes gene_type:complete